VDAAAWPSLVTSDEVLVRLLLRNLPPLRHLLGFMEARRLNKTDDNGEFCVGDEVCARKRQLVLPRESKTLYTKNYPYIT
jgi:hypothetical protein